MKDGYSITLQSAHSQRHAVCLSNLHVLLHVLEYLRFNICPSADLFFAPGTFCGSLSLLNLEFRGYPPPLVEHARDHPAHKDLNFN